MICFNNTYYFNTVKQLGVKRSQEHQLFCSLGVGQKLKACRRGIKWVPEKFPSVLPTPFILSPPLSPLSFFLFSFPSSSSPTSLLSSFFLSQSLSLSVLTEIKLTLISMVQAQAEVSEKGKIDTATLFRDHLNAIYNKEFCAK